MMLRKYVFIILCVFLCAACAKEKPTKKNVKSNNEDKVVVVRDGDYACNFNIYAEHGSAQWGTAITSLGESPDGALLKIRRISDNKASVAISFPNGRVISNNGLRLQKPANHGTEYTAEPDLMGNSRQPGVSFAYNYLPKGEIAVTATVGFVFPTIIVNMDKCVALNENTANYKNKK